MKRKFQNSNSVKLLVNGLLLLSLCAISCKPPAEPPPSGPREEEGGVHQPSNPGGNGESYVGVVKKVRSVAGQKAAGVRILNDGYVMTNTTPLQASAVTGTALLNRFNAKLDIDTAFGIDGSESVSAAGKIIQQSDEKILVSGPVPTQGGCSTPPCYGNYQVSRYLQDGTLDTSFAQNGKLDTGLFRSETFSEVNVPANDDHFQITDDDRLIIFGNLSSQSAYNHNRRAKRFLPNGALDTTLSGTGTQAFPDVTRPHLAVLSDETFRFHDINRVFGYFSNGGVDTSFGTNGVINFVSTVGPGIGIQSTPDGGFIVVGDYGGEVRVAKYFANGVRDLTFGTGQGWIALPLFMTVTAVQIDVNSAGMITIGYSGTTKEKRDKSSIIVARLRPNGKLDSTFGHGGIAAQGLTEDSHEWLRAMHVYSDGRVAVVANRAKYNHDNTFNYRVEGYLVAVYGIDGF